MEVRERERVSGNGGGVACLACLAVSRQDGAAVDLPLGAVGAPLCDAPPSEGRWWSRYLQTVTALLDQCLTTRHRPTRLNHPLFVITPP